ncbi:MAG: endonuclease domain-containing protein [Gammaproteobacteria bacterium]
MPAITKERARAFRQHGTDAEEKLWYYLRAGRLAGLKFRRQHPIQPYVVDFYCETAKLVVELDGSQHTKESDANRARFLEAAGLRIARFWDNEVLQQTQAVLAVILTEAQKRTLTPNPSPGGRGE